MIPVMAPRCTETILLVDDEPASRASARDALEGQGYTVVAAGSAEEALLAAARHAGPIHLLLTDVAMPGMSGFDLAERLAPRRSGMQVVYMSVLAHHLRRLAGGALRSGAPFIAKPFTVEVLSEKIREVLDHRSPFVRPARARASAPMALAGA